MPPSPTKLDFTASTTSLPRSVASSKSPTSPTISSGKSITSSMKVTVSGRGGSGNIRRVSVDGVESLQIKSRSSNGTNSTQEDKRDEVFAPKGLSVGAASGIKTSGRGGTGNIGNVRRALGPNTATVAALDAREKEVLEAHRAKKLAQASQTRTGRGGLGNIKPPANQARSKSQGPPANKGKGKAFVIAGTSSVLSSRRSSSSSRRSSSHAQWGNAAKIRDSAHKSKITSHESGRSSTLSSADALNDDGAENVRSEIEDNKPIASTSKAGANVIPFRLPSPLKSLSGLATPPPIIDPAAGQGLTLRPHSPLSAPSSPRFPPRALFDPLAASSDILSASSGNTLATKWDTLYAASKDSSAASVTSRPASPVLHIKQTKMSASGGGEWRLVTHVREERRGRHQLFIEEQGWEYFGPQEMKSEAMEMKVLAKAKRNGMHLGTIGGGLDAAAGPETKLHFAPLSMSL